jgi:hypothetical protein
MIDLPVPSPVVFLLEDTALLHFVVELLIIDLGIVVSLEKEELRERSYL